MSTNDAYAAAMEAQQLLGELMDQVEHYLRVTNTHKEQLLRTIDGLLDQDEEFKSNLIDKMSDLLESNNVNAQTVVDVARVLLKADNALDASDEDLRVVVTGNPVDGFAFYGPITKDEAGERDFGSEISSDWWIVELDTLPNEND